VKIKPVDIEREETLSFALGEISVSENVFVKIKTEKGVSGVGEAAPFLPGTGENQDSVVAVLNEVRNLVEGEDIENYRELIQDLRSRAPGNPTALMAIESALLDSYTRLKEMPISELFGGKPENLKTCLTISMTSPDKIRKKAKLAEDQGCETIKMKLEGDFNRDLRRVEALNEVVDCDFILDANQGFNPKSAVKLLRKLESKDMLPELMEQPVDKKNISGMKYVKEGSVVPIAADESVFTPKDALEIVNKDAADIINLKIGKSGILQSIKIAEIASSANIGLMMGCMSESKVAIHTAAHIASGYGAFEYLDLDGIVRSPKQLEETDKTCKIPLEGPGHGIKSEYIK
jgi:L-alanine-DL-glutamate epimerase-like enolase superfamily enzyme